MRRIDLAWHPPVGVFIALLALISVLVPFFRDLEAMGQREKALWTVIFFALVLLEIRSIYLDRSEHDREEASARLTQLEGFKSIADGINTTSIQNQQQFAATMKRSDEIMEGVQDSINSITGGDSYAYVVFGDLKRAGAFISVVHGGKYPLHGVTARMTDVNKFKEMVENEVPLTLNNPSDINLTVGDISANAARPMQTIKFSGTERQDYNIFFNGRNGFWSELVRMRWIDNKWVSAVKVLGADGRNVLFERVDPAFPRTNEKVDWD
ncbi:MAG TPA: hypothetical protein VNK23_14235 [Candidatus Dormibacteraeota bacterium]|nr:hypothetical protein [Candidatus Dormibacteraeota bacterium]